MLIAINELRNLPSKELLTELRKAEKELLQYKIGVKTAQKKEIHKIHSSKKMIAQIHTIINERRQENTDKSNKNDEKRLAEKERAS